jgi:glycogen operon protein
VILSQGIPMLMAGDEFGRTQRGNNNAYCQDNEISWLDWDSADHDLTEFVQRVTKLRHDHPVFRRRQFFTGMQLDDFASDADHSRLAGEPSYRAELGDIEWYTPYGTVMFDGEWHEPSRRALTVFLNGHGIVTRDERGQRIVDDSFLILFNVGPRPTRMSVPPELANHRWHLELSTADPTAGGDTVISSVVVEPWSVLVLSDRRI